MATKIYISGKFLIAEDEISRDLFFKMKTSKTIHYRSSSDIFAFFIENGDPRIEGYVKRQQLGRQEAWNFDQPDPVSKTTFEFSDILDEAGIEYASADALDQFLNENLGVADVSVDITGFLTSVSTDATLTGDGTPSDPLSIVPIVPSIGNFSQTQNGATINTIGEQSIIGSGVGSLSIPADSFVVGDSFHAKLGGLINATGGGGRSEITINIKSDGTILATSGAFDLDNATDQGWEVELDMTIRAIGEIGSIATNGNFAYTKNANRQIFGYIFQDVQTLNTTALNTLDITFEWNVLNTGDDIFASNFVLYKVF